ncbi:hypothetical protein ACFQX7_07075 [Luedemannella flava]
MEQVNLTLRRADWPGVAGGATITGLGADARELLGLPRPPTTP